MLAYATYHPPLALSRPAARRLLTPSECVILELVARRLRNKDIARVLSICPETVKWHLRNLYTKLDVRRRHEAVLRARYLGEIA